MRGVCQVPPDWDARPEADGGQLKWWIVPEEGGGGEEDAAAAASTDALSVLQLPGAEGGDPGVAAVSPADKYGADADGKRTVDPQAGRVVLFKARTVIHEVLPTHRKRFALTLWYFDGRRD